MNQSQFQLATGVSGELAARWFVHIEKAMQQYGITNPLDQAMFLAQMGTESGGYTRLVENLNYAADKLVGVFGAKRITQQQADQYGRNSSHPANQEAIANIVYGGDWGKANLGNMVQGDGWKFRGRGLKQITGRENYQKCSAAIGVDLITAPDWLLQDDAAAMSAAWFYVSRGCLNHTGDVKAITKIINGGTNGLDDRQARYDKAKAVLV
ncbi:glycoside hydrolase family 19 protein [Salmonella enterica]|nr:glycoside hydrolase family 19 protein [Salmonella enterica]EFA3283565.1 glycoside hydrolase family 19 protein [Salmonella enterica]EIY5380650.1 glycoside hydrolase family 19 protein [Salmonella enterica]ELS7530263.1 glycoside hydrolase family 19 protein [Salmonella enterica]